MKPIWIPLLALCISLHACGGERPAPPQPEPFDAEMWRRGSERDRYAMHENLIARGLLQGRTHAEVIDLLGPPDWEGVARPGIPPALWYWIDTGVVFRDERMGDQLMIVPLVILIDPATEVVDTVEVGGWEY